MTREQFFFKYGCECKDPNCSSVVKNKCSAEFFRDLDSVFESHLKVGDLIWREAAIQSLRTAQVNFTVESNINFADYKSEIQQIIDGVIAAQEAAIRKIGADIPDEEDEFIGRLKIWGDLFKLGMIGKCVADWVKEHGELSAKNKAIVQQLIADNTEVDSNPDKAAENDFINRLIAHATYMNQEQLSQLVENWIRMHGPLTLKNGEIVSQLLESEKEDE